MTTPSHDIGDARTLRGKFRVAGVLTDPAGVRFIMIEPDGVETPYVWNTDAELIRESVGVFKVVWKIRKPGRHRWRMEGTGAATAAESKEFWARRAA